MIIENTAIYTLFIIALVRLIKGWTYLWRLGAGEIVVGTKISPRKYKTNVIICPPFSSRSTTTDIIVKWNPTYKFMDFIFNPSVSINFVLGHI